MPQWHRSIVAPLRSAGRAPCFSWSHRHILVVMSWRQVVDGTVNEMADIAPIEAAS